MNKTPLIVTVAPNGAYKTKEQHPQVPLTAVELAQTAKQCLDAGAAMIHMHIRKADGSHLLDAHGYKEATQAVRKAVGHELVVQITSEAAQVYTPHVQMQVVRDTQPEAVSIGLREIVRPEVPEADVADFFSWLARNQVMTQVILYDAADVQTWQDLRARDVIGEAPWFLLFVLGRYSAGQVSAPTDLLPFLQVHDNAYPWAMCAFGPQEHACATAAAALGGHVRVGFENNLYLKSGKLAPDNAALVRQVAEAAECLVQPLATADQVRQLFTV
ncbi:3-keto-5-aminohexanoate cleavage protein [Alcaligenes endophyticus]|uniref:3-keto-5-aminohexanoate cleavage protein n=1 Tax=Alcaligenes endophyticus TaxID=1929088 RepID=A0ABT8EFH8_9BURK|nr:3-keto-5-aminohexanoate cleavage protein [Alcaligenes endophyticus]MCX5590379.1 3-keto-5-aminohexanoate cleavage protein [Alcaligenes endophyticus]MDN4119957.1 3-keto-5-aminohexanoate cleavage protein [Alcaligenes endophyticus]